MPANQRKILLKMTPLAYLYKQTEKVWNRKLKRQVVISLCIYTMPKPQHTLSAALSNLEYVTYKN